MRYLLDTHVVLWSFGNKEKLSNIAVRVILDPAHEKYVSMTSAWEKIETAIRSMTDSAALESLAAHVIAPM